MDTELLRRWKILGNLKDDELNNIAYVVMYGDPLVSLQTSTLSTVENAIFIVKGSNKVYGVGSNNLLASKYKFPMVEYFPPSGGKVKIDKLSGLELVKIVVGCSFVGGLDKSGKAHLWYFPLMPHAENEVVVMFERYTSSTKQKLCQIESCRCGHGYLYKSHSVGKADLCVCSYNNNLFRTYTAKSPPPEGTSVIKFVNSNVSKMICTGCSRQCTSGELGGHSLEYCSHCDLYPEYSAAAISSAAPVKFEQSNLVDIACGENFVAMLTRFNELIVHGQIKKVSCYSSVCNPDQVVIKQISCGSNHLAAISTHGDLYTCGSGDLGQLGYASNEYDLTLRRVNLEGVVVKVCCGHSATVCLMLDGSLYCFGSRMKLNEKGSLLVNQLETDFVTRPTKLLAGEKFVDIAHVPFTSKFFARTKSLVHNWGHKSTIFPFPEIVSGASILVEALTNQPIALSCGDSSLQKNHQIPHTLQTDYAFLYGKTHLSDYVLKLSDGDIPVHGLVLFTNSVYFRENVLKDTDPPSKELDMTSYNPVAYRALLKYFYLHTLDDLDCSDLVDLYLLAMSYKETDILLDSYNRIIEKMSCDTVKWIHLKAKEAGCKDLLEQCNVFMRTPKFQAKLLEFFAQNTDATLSLLS